MKSYTDLEQSKKLAEILPIESADMCYIKHSSSNNPSWEFNEDFPPMILGNVPINEMAVETLPCWSLAALLGVLPKTINFGNENDSTFFLNSLENGKYLADYYEISYVKDNPVDACVDMIIKLKEKGLL